MVEYMTGEGYVDYVVVSSYHEDGYYADFFDRYAASVACALRAPFPPCRLRPA